MKNNEFKKFVIDIIFPSNCPNASPRALALCEGLIARLVFSSQNQLKIRINTALMLVECNDPKTKKYLDLVLKSRIIGELYNQFKELLFERQSLK